MPQAAAPGNRAPMVSGVAQPAEWDAFIEGHPEGTVEHLWAWRDVLSQVFGHESVYLVARRGDTITGALPLALVRSRLFGRVVVSLPFANYAGLVTSDAEAASALAEGAASVARAFRASHVELRNVGSALDDLPLRTHKVGSRLPLPATTDALWSRLDRKVRNQVRKAQKEGLCVAVGGGELLDEFYSVFSTNMRDLGTPVFPAALFAETVAAFAARVHVVRLGGRPVAAGVGLMWRDTMLVPWASSLRAFRHLSPNMLLYWSLLESATAAGLRTFDFGRSTAGGGTHQFKQQWGAEDVALHWRYLMLTRGGIADHGTGNSRLARAAAAWSRLPVWLANGIGPAITRHLY